MRIEKLLLDLIEINTENPPGNISELAKFIREILVKEGFEIKKCGGLNKEKFNLIAKRGNPKIALLSHMDTVPIGDRKNWKYKPEGEIKGDKIFGRGAVDTKGGMAAAISAAIKSKNSFLIFTFDEEVGLIGAKQLIKEEIPEKIIVIEPTNLNFAIENFGALGIKLTMSGRAMHASLKEEGANAIENAAKMIVEFERLVKETKEIFNIGKIKGGEKINVVADKCELEIDIRFKNNENKERLIDWLKKWGEIEILVDLPSFKADKTFVKECLQILNKKPKLISKKGCTEAGVLEKEGKKCVVFGPGDQKMAHTSNEFITKSQLEEAEKMFIRLFTNFR